MVNVPPFTPFPICKGFLEKNYFRNAYIFLLIGITHIACLKYIFSSEPYYYGESQNTLHELRSSHYLIFIFVILLQCCQIALIKHL